MTDGLFVLNFLKTVSTGPSSRSFPHVDKLDEITIMNSAEEISKYSDNNSHYRSPTLARRAGKELEEPHPEKPKKDKKWSLGGFFRRRKKEVESESSTEEETPHKRGFLQRRKQRKEDKRKKRANKSLGHFDHIVVTPIHPTNNYIVNGNREDESGGIFSEPAIPSYNSTSKTTERISSRESLNKRQDLNLSRGSLASQDSTGKKSRREKVKARAEALRDRLKNESSSDEGSQRSTTSSITRFKSDDSLSRKDGTSRKSRAARTERYQRRLTKEDEHVLNKEAEVEKQRISKSDADVHQTRVQVNRWVVVDEMPKSPPIKPYIKPTLNYSPSVPLQPKSYSGVSTIPPSHNMIHRTTSNLSDGPRNYFNASHKPSNIYKNAIRHPSDPMRSIPRNYNSYHEKQDFKPEQRSFSYDCNINRSPTPGSEEQVLHVHFPIGKPIPKQRNPNLINQNIPKSTPPPPPPRDPQRRIFTNSQYENSRPMSYAFENGNQSRIVPVHQATIDRNSSIRSYNMPPTTQANINRAHSFGWQPNFRSNSEDHIVQANHFYQPPVVNRPASATPDAPQQRFIRRHPNPEQYKYFAEKTPRSRKPIHIAAAPLPDQTYLSDSQVVTRTYSNPRHPVHAASEFWKQKDAEEITRRKSQLIDQKDKTQKPVKKPEEVKKNFAVLSIPVKTADSLSSLSGNSDTSPLNTKPFFEPNTDVRPLSMVLEKGEAQEVKKEPPEPPVRRYSRQSSASSTENNWGNGLDEAEKKKRRSSNLEDALDELEAIYKSLRLGDEDLLDRAERRDVPPAVTQKLLTKMPDTYVNWGTPGTQSDSGFNYDFDCIDGLRKKRNPRRSTIPDKLNDDMAYRRLNKDRPPPLDPSVAVSQVSYLLASPVLGAPPVDENDNESVKTANEPDITLDDVVYRNIKHTNNSLKVAEPQPFGIPLGPITTASNSDYLHAVPEDNIRPRFIPRKSPDIVKDDLAYRSLRKDSPGLAADDYINNNNSNNKTDLSLKKRRAVRSISANIYNMMHKDTLRATESENEFDKAQSLTDIADAMEIARQILKDRQNKIYRKSISSDTETKPIKSSLNCSNTQTSTETLTESKSNLLNDAKDQKMQIHLSIPGTEETVNQKPPICPTPDRKSSKPPTKESTPNRVSPAPEENLLDNNHLSDLLTVLAIEARETSEKLGNDLKLLDEEQSRKPSPRISQSTTPAREGAKSPVLIKSLDEKLSDIDAVSEHAKLCEKLLGAVVESTKLISHSIPANNETELEEVSDMSEPKIYKSVANVIVTRKADVPETDTRSEQCSESEHDYENIHKDDEDEELEEDMKCTSPFLENKTKLLADFEELKKDLFSDVNEKLDNVLKNVDEEQNETKLLADFEELQKDLFSDNKLDTVLKNVDEDQNKTKLLSDLEELKKDLFSDNDKLDNDQIKDNKECATPAPVDDAGTFEKLQDSCSEGGEVCSAVVCLASNPSTQFDHSNDIFTPPEAFIASTEFDSHFNDIQNYIPLINRTRGDSEHSSGFHTESRGSSSTDSSLYPILDFGDNQNLPELKLKLVTQNDEICDILHKIVDKDFVEKSDSDISNNSLESSKDEADCSLDKNISEDTSFLNEPHFVSRSNNFHLALDSKSDNTSSNTEQMKDNELLSQNLLSTCFDKPNKPNSISCFENNVFLDSSIKKPFVNFCSDSDSKCTSLQENLSSYSVDVSDREFINLNTTKLSDNFNSDSIDIKDCQTSSCKNNSEDMLENLSTTSNLNIDKLFTSSGKSESSNSSSSSEDNNNIDTLRHSCENRPEVYDLTSSTLDSDESTIQSTFSSSIALHDNSLPSTSSSIIPSNCKSMDGTQARRSCEEEPEERLDSNSALWFRDPTTLALACSYTLAFVPLAIVDVLTLLGLILAIVTVIAAFIL